MLESNVVSFTVPFVQGKGRPRFSSHSGVYTPKETEAAEVCIWKAYAEKSKETYGKVLSAPIGTPVHVIIKAYAEMPASIPKSHGDSEPFTQKPDVDNITKCVLDALNPVNKRIGKTILTRQGAWVDDSQVVRVISHKVERRRGEHEHTDITIIWSQEDPND